MRPLLALVAALVVPLVVPTIGCDSPPGPVGVAQPDPSRPRGTPGDATPSSTQPSDAGQGTASDACQFAVRLPYPRVWAPTPLQMLDQVATQNDRDRFSASASCADLARISDPDEMFEIVAAGMLAGLGAVEVSRTKLEWMGRPGIEVVSRIAADRTPPGVPWTGEIDFRFRILVQDLRIYQLLVMQAADNVDAVPKATAFFESLALRGEAPANAEVPWTTQTVGDFTVEAPGTRRSPDDKAPGIIEDVGFVHARGRTGFSMTIWRDDVPGAGLTPTQKLRAFFLLHYTSDAMEIVAETETTLGDWPALEVHYRPNFAVPPEIDDKTKAIIESRPLGFRMRLVAVDDEILALRVQDRQVQADVARYFGSLQRAK